MQIDKIKARIQKLLALSKDDAAAQGEIDNAIRFATKLMDEHQLTEADVEKVDDIKSDIKSAKMGRASVVLDSSRKATWESWLSFYIAELVGVGRYNTNEYIGNLKRKKYVFYGSQEDADIAAELFSELRATIISMARLRYGGVYQNAGRSYAEGFAMGVGDSIQAQKKETKALADSQSKMGFGQNALVVIEKRNEILALKYSHAKRWVRTQGVNLVSQSSQAGGRHFENANKQGREDGNKQSLSVNRKPKLSG